MGIIQIVVGLLLMVGRYVSRGLTLLGPVLVNILFYDFLLDTARLAIGLVCT